MEALQRLLPGLCKDHGLTSDQVVAIASQDGGKQALEAVQQLLPELLKEHGLRRSHVVAVASNSGGKRALEALQRLLPGLCKDHGLTTDQVVTIASQDAGGQALESIFAQLSRPDPALAALSKDRLVALACLGGRLALETVIKGLARAPILIRRANRRVPEHTSHRAADPAKIVQVLSFFHCHSNPQCAFDEAMKHFEMSGSELLQLLRHVGVTELEARNGTLPPTSRRWQRILQAFEAETASAPRQGQWHAVADSLEREADAATPMHETGQALASSGRKRSRSDNPANRSPQQTAPARVSEQPDGLHALVPGGWGIKRPRTKIGGGLPDPGTPTEADLATSSTLFVQHDAGTFAGAEDDFPAFNDEETAWLMTLFPY